MKALLFIRFSSSFVATLFACFLLFSCTNPLGSSSTTDSQFLFHSIFPASIAVSAGNNPTAGVGTAVPTFTVLVSDNTGKPMPSVTIHWSIITGGGSLSTSTATTDSSGLASAILTLGPAAGTNTVTASVPGTAVSINFSATGVWDTNANAYFTRVTTANGGTDPISTTEKENLNSFIVGLKNGGYYSSLTALWSYRSGQNVGSGNTVVEFFGAHNGTIVNSPTWSTDGIVFNAANQEIDYATSVPVGFTTGGYTVFAFWSGMGSAVTAGADYFAFLSSSGSELFYYVTTGVGGGTTWLEQARNFLAQRWYYFGSSVSPTGNHSYVWNASNWTLYRDGTALSVGTQPTSAQTDGNYTLKTLARTLNSSRITCLLLFPSTLTLSNTDVSTIYSLYKTTIGQGLSLP
jgi:hypothetical protein